MRPLVQCCYFAIFIFFVKKKFKILDFNNINMPVPQGYQVAGGQGPTCVQKLKMGFAMGAVIGASTGVLLGGFSVFRMGLRGKEAFRQVGKIAAQSGGSFGIFMMVAQGLRC
ncbi:Protein MGR2-like protein [Aphelenchoides bicaudatus]|nr:Protein MGR2-like protein [Aphelenchoides bicaudatus]